MIFQATSVHPRGRRGGGRGGQESLWIVGHVKNAGGQGQIAIGKQIGTKGREPRPQRRLGRCPSAGAQDEYRRLFLMIWVWAHSLLKNVA
jgi:hypothetical protein